MRWPWFDPKIHHVVTATVAIGEERDRESG